MNYKKFNDYELIYMVRENDELSKGIIMEKYIPIIRKIASEYYQKFLNYGFEYEDFLQEAQLAFYQALGKFDESKNVLFYTFVNMYIRKKMASFCRNISSKKNSFVNTNAISLENDDYEDVRSDLDLISHEQDFQRVIHDVIYSSPFLLGVILELRYNEFTFREISKLLDIPLSTVQYWSRKIRKEVYLQLQKKYYDN